MRITTRNINKDVITPKELKEATKFFFSKLVHPNLAKNLEIEIVMADIADKGVMEWMDKPVKPREFRIILSSKYKKRQTLLTLAHECAHVKQYATGELRDETLRAGIQWNKKNLNEKKIDYWDLPYEIDARGREEGLYVRYLETLPGYTVKVSNA